MLNIKRGIKKTPVKMVIYGSEGIGKTTLASNAPNVLFIDTEDGTKHLDVQRIDPAPQTWNELISTIKEVANERPCSTLVVDTADWAEKLAISAVTSANRVDNIEEIPYGKGYTMVGDTFRQMLSALDTCVANGINVIVTAHAAMKKIEQPDAQGAYDHWSLKLTKQTAPLLKEWCDALLFANYRTFVEKDKNGTVKATGGQRKLFTSHTPYWDAKNRFGYDEMLNMEFSSIAEAFIVERSELDVLLEANGFMSSEATILVSGRRSKFGETEQQAHEWIINNFEIAKEFMLARRENND